MIRKKKPEPVAGFDRAARDALRATPVRIVTNTGMNRATYRARRRAARLARPAAAAAPAPLSRHAIVRLRSQTARANEEARMPEPENWTVTGGYSATGNTWLCPDCGFGVGGLLSPVSDGDELDPVGDHIASHMPVVSRG